MRGEGVGQTQLRGKLRTEERGTQDVHGDFRTLPRDSVHAVHGGGLTQETLQLLDLGGEAHRG